MNYNDLLFFSLFFTIFVFFYLFQQIIDGDCVTEMAVHYGKTKKEMEQEICQVSSVSLFFKVFVVCPVKTF